MRRQFLLLFVCSLVFSVYGISRKAKELVQNRRQIRDIFKKHPKFDGDPTETSDSLPHVCNVLKYDLQLSPYFPFPGYAGREDLTFDGFVNITFEITKKTQYLPLRMNYLTVFEIFLWHNGEKMTISSLKNDPGTSHFKLRPIKAFVVGDKYTLSISYGGNINNKDKGMGSWAGLTYDIYALPDSSKRYAISTFLRPAFAREVFPSLDDPSFKSVFSLTLIYPKNAKAYYNSVAESTDVYDDQRWITKFKDTQLLSTYRLALVIGDFTNVTMIADAALWLFLIGSMGSRRQRKLQKKCANSFARLTNVPYPLEKLDLAAFTFLAEYELSDGFGLISGSEELLIISPKFFDRTETFEIALPICSAIVGQQFGGSVTQKHWGMEFLTRSFTHFYNIRSYAEQLPAADRDIFEIYAFSGVDEGLIVTNGSGHPLIDDQVHFDEQVEYAGPAVIGMIEQVVGRKVFHKAIEKYLRENKFGNADLETLISAFENATKNEPLCGDQLKIREFMTDFFASTVLSNDNGYSFKQQSSSMGWNDTTRWNIPLFVLNVNTQKVHTLWLLKSGEICSPIDLNSTETYIFNYRGLTFGRILYDEVIWTTKFLNVDWTQVDDASPIALIIDRLEEEARTQKDSLAEQLINKIVNDFNALINPYLVSIIMDLNDQDLEDRLFVNIDWYPKTLSDEFQNYNLLLLAILDGYSDYQQVGLLKFKNFMSDCAHFETELETCNKISPNVRLGVYCAGIIDGDPNSLAFFYDYTDFVGTQSEFYPYLWPEFDRAEEALSCDKTVGAEGRKEKLKHRRRTTQNL
ncbi:Aminopeptidase N [Aphelenchoides besseyi]|nr:Aminopeptidase N [Aphelenchoides besseyi]